MRKQYNIYATLLDGFSGYLNSNTIYEAYWGFSENPAKSAEEFEKEQFQSLIDRINRVPFASEAADKGTAFNEIVDCIILGQKSDKMEIASDKGQGTITARYNGRTFVFPTSLCREFADYYKGACPQVYTEAMLPTSHGDVKLYGYIDELMPNSVHDIKTTSKYAAGKYRNGWQHVVYPYCLNAEGCNITLFEYNIAEIGKYGGIATYTETYNYIPEIEVPKLTDIAERFIEFLEWNGKMITDRKIFNKA